MMTDLSTSVESPAWLRTPEDPGWDSARPSFNLLLQERPDAVAVVESADDVIAAVAHARERGMRVAAQGTGHGAMAVGSLDQTLLIDASRLRDVHIDAKNRRVRVGAGVRWRDVVPQLSDLGLAALHGSSPDVGIVGYSLGGGIGWLARKHGMQTNAVRAIELVTAEAELIRVDAASHPDLFWAMRGGGGSFGIVTAIEFDVFEVPDVYCGALFFPVERTSEVLGLWSTLLPTFPEELTTWVTIAHFPPMEEVPEVFRGRSFAIVMAAHVGSADDARATLQPLLDLVPEFDTLAVQPPLCLAPLAMDPEQPVPYRSATALVDKLSGESIEAIARAAAPGSGVTMVQLRHGGGALSRSALGSGARATLPGEIVVFTLGVVPESELDAQVEGQLARVISAVAGRIVGEYPNFVERPTDASSFFSPTDWQRLRTVKASYDPTDRIRGMHHVPPASSRPVE